MDAELNHRSMEVRKCAGVLKSVWKNRNVIIEVGIFQYLGIDLAVDGRIDAELNLRKCAARFCT